MSVIIFGGYGTFGALVARELAANGIQVSIAGRDLNRAEPFTQSLGPLHKAVVADVRNLQSCRTAVTGHDVAVNCAGPFHGFGPELLEACLESRCHYADIADDRAYCALVRDYHDKFRRRSRAAVYGCSSLPAISGALGCVARNEASDAPQRARVTLFIGNNNPKGGAAIRSLLKSLGKPIRAPQGTIRVFSGREVVPLPEPIGKRAGFNVESPEYDLFPAWFGVRSLTVKVVFELPQSNYIFAALAILGRDYAEATARFLERIGNRFRAGSSAGAVMTELFYADGSTRRAVLHTRQDGQRMAAMPCAIAVQRLCGGESVACGAMTAYDLLGAEPLLQQIHAAGYALDRATSPTPPS